MSKYYILCMQELFATLPRLVRNGLAPDGRQRYLCRDCGQRCREQPRSNAYTEPEREQILRAYDERSSLRGLTRTFGVSRNTVTAWIKKR